jgi:cytoskeletal protein CcmA (bactofilin family)
MNMSAGIGQTIRIKGEVTAREPFLIAGQIEGTVEVDGHTLTVAEGATVAATVSADTVIIHGNVKGDMSAATKIVVQPTAKVGGELSAPTISVTEGAFIQGRIETTRRTAKLAVAS